MKLSEVQESLLQQGIEELGLDCSNRQFRQLVEYANLILKWNNVYNLTAITDPKEVVTHHLLDSLSALPCLTPLLSGRDNQLLLDVGSGAGLPGLVFSIMCPTLQVHTLDTVQKKVAFMQQVIALLELKKVQAIHFRVERYQSDQKYDLITSRAFSSLVNLIDWSSHLLKPSGYYFALKGRLEKDNQLPNNWKIESTHALNVPFLPEERNIFVITR